MTLDDLMNIKGIGLAKACQILAAIELVERVKPRFPEEVLDSLDKVLQVISELRFTQREHIVGLYLNARMRLVHKEVLAVGSVNQSIIMPRDVFAVIKNHPVVFFILAHNHPTGDVQPSTDDVIFTHEMQKAGMILGVELLDHVIVGKNNHFSFKQSHMLKSISPS